MEYRIPDGWPLPCEIVWYTCNTCGMIYGDGEFSQGMLNDYYRNFYGYGVSNPDNVKRLEADALMIAGLTEHDLHSLIVDFGGAGDDGRSHIVETLTDLGYLNAVCIGPGAPLPANCAVIYASHVLEHVYDLPEVMRRLTAALAHDGTLVADVPDALGLLDRWRMPILDFNTKHINHFTLRHLLELGYHHGLTAVSEKRYELEFAPCIQVQFQRRNVAHLSYAHIAANMTTRREALEEIGEPVNVWGMSDIAWHLLSRVDLNVVDYIDNDPAYRGATYRGKPVLERPTRGNDAPIVIMAQGQRGRLIANIRAMGVQNEIIEI
jgi:hypothetical protein